MITLFDPKTIDDLAAAPMQHHKVSHALFILFHHGTDFHWQSLTPVPALLLIIIASNAHVHLARSRFLLQWGDHGNCPGKSSAC
jgi:hypothetical protein